MQRPATSVWAVTNAVKVCAGFGLDIKTTWLGLGRDHALGQNKYLTYAM